MRLELFGGEVACSLNLWKIGKPRKDVLEFIKDNLYNFPIVDIVSTRKVYNPRAKTQHGNGGGVGVGREESFECGIYPSCV